MIPYLRDVLALGFPLAVGWPIVVALTPARGWLARFGLAFLFGSAASGVVLTVVGIVGVPLRLEVLAVLLLTWLVGWGVVLRRRLAGLRAQLAWPRPVIHPVAGLLIGLTLINLVTAALYAVRTPIGISDVLHIWLPKADGLARTHSLLALSHTIFPDYPPVWPLQLFLTRDLAGHASTVKLLPTLYLTSLLAVMFGYLASRTTPLLAAATVWVLSGIPYLWFPYGVNDLMAEVPFMALLVASAICLIRYIEEDDVRQLLAAVVLTTATALLRPEGIQHAVVIGVLAAVIAWKRGPWKPVFALPVATPLLAYASWNLAVRLAPHAARGYAVNPARLLGVVTPEAFVTIANYGIHWLANPFVFGPTVIAACLCFAGYRSWRATWPWLTVFALDLAAIGATYLIAPASNDQPLSWWLATGFKRMLLHIVPLLFIAGAVAIAGLLKTPHPNPPPQGGREQQTPDPDPLPQGGREWGRVIIPALSFLVAAVLTVVVAGPATVRVADLVPNGVVVVVPPLGFGRLTPAGWVDDSGPGADSMQLRVEASTRGAVSYDLKNLGERLAANDAVVGRFTSVDATVGALASGAGSRFQVTANDRAIGSAPSAADSTSLQASIPPDTRTLSLVAEAVANGSSVQSIWVRAVLHRGGAWPLVAGLLLLAAVVAVVGALRTPYPDPPPQGGRESRARQGRTVGTLVALLLAAALVQQLDVFTNEAVPLWSQTAHSAAHRLRSG